MPHQDHASPTHGLDTEATSPVSRPYVFYQPLPREKPEKHVIHGLEDVLPQPEDSSTRLEDKVRLLRALAGHVDAESARVHAHEQQQVLTRLVAARDDEPTFTQLLEAEGSVLSEIHDDSVTAVVPPPQTGVVTGVETAHWRATIDTLQRLQARCTYGRASLRRVVKTYQDRLSCAGSRRCAPNAAVCGTDIATSFWNRSGACATAVYAVIAPQSWPTSTAGPSPASASAIASASSASEATW